MEIKCVVAAVSADGTPDFYACIVRCSKAQYENGDHYDEAKMQAFANGFEQSALAYDENDGPEWLFKQFQWDDMKAVNVGDES